MSKHKPKNYFDERGNLIIKPYRLIDLAAIFDVNYQTLKRWIRSIACDLGNPNGKYYSVKQVEYMIGQFGLPRKVDINTNEETLYKAA